MLNFIWTFFFLGAFATGLAKWALLGDQTVFAKMMQALFSQLLPKILKDHPALGAA